MPEPASYRYDAFISYRHVEPDRRWAKWLHRALETFRTPKPLVQRGAPPRIKRVFRDEDELPASADLSKEIDIALEQSRFLIVVCSPRTPESQWVNQEVVRFREMGRHDRILALLIEGEPGQAFPRSLREIRTATTDQQGSSHQHVQEVEPLAADVREERDERTDVLKRMALLRFVAALIGCRFDDLRRRDADRKRKKLLVATASLTALVLALATLTVFALASRADALRSDRIAKSELSIATTYAASMMYGHPMRYREADQLMLANVPAEHWNWEHGYLYLRTILPPHLIRDAVGAAMHPSGTMVAVATPSVLQIVDLNTATPVMETPLERVSDLVVPVVPGDAVLIRTERAGDVAWEWAENRMEVVVVGEKEPEGRVLSRDSDAAERWQPVLVIEEAHTHETARHWNLERSAYLTFGADNSSLRVLDPFHRLLFARDVTSEHWGISGSGSYGASLAWSPDGSRLAVEVEGGSVQILDGRTGRTLLRLDEAGKRTKIVGWRRDGKVLVVQRDDGVLLLESALLRVTRLSAPEQVLHVVSALPTRARRLWADVRHLTVGSTAEMTMGFEKPGRELLEDYAILAEHLTGRNRTLLRDGMRRLAGDAASATLDPEGGSSQLFMASIQFTRQVCRAIENLVYLIFRGDPRLDFRAWHADWTDAHEGHGVVTGPR